MEEDALAAAAADPDIAGLYLPASAVEAGRSPGLGALQEVRAAIEAFRAAGKPVKARLEFAGTREMFLASAADDVVLDPFGAVVLLFDQAVYGSATLKTGGADSGAGGIAFALVELGFTKADVRAASAAVGLPIWDKPAAACLSSRIPYGTSVTEDRLGRIGGFEAVRAERLILDAPLFGFSRAEIENAIDSALRLRLVSEQRLRTRVLARHHQPINGSRALVEALVDTGGESRLERWFLRLCREAGLPRPRLQVTYRSNSRTIARVDAEFPGGLIVEVMGHGTHSTRRQSQADYERSTELTLRGKRVISFTYADIRDRPDWVVSVLRRALRLAA